jgi:hypothetical protein
MNLNKKPNTQLNDSSAHRKRKKQEEKKKIVRLRVIFFALAAVGIVIFIFNIGRITEPFRGIVRRTGTDPGYPVKLPGSANYFMDNFDDGFLILTETYVYIYGADGGFVYSHQHGYRTPRAVSGDKRALVYDENGRSFSFYGINDRMYEKLSEDRIFYGTIGETNDRVAIVYRSGGYANILEIFNGQGDWVYRKRFADENIMQIEFASSDTEVIVTSIGFDGTDWSMTAAVRRFNTASDADALWRTELPSNMLPFAVRAVGSNVFVLCDGAIFVLNYTDGQIIGSHSYSGTLIDYTFADSAANNTAAAILVDDHSAGVTNLILFDSFARPSGIVAVSPGASQAEIQGSVIIVLEPTRIAEYSSDLQNPLVTRLDEEYARFINLGSDILLLSFNTVEKLSNISNPPQTTP